MPNEDDIPYLYAFWEGLDKGDIAIVRRLAHDRGQELPTRLYERLLEALHIDPDEAQPAELATFLRDFASGLRQTTTVTVGPPIEGSRERSDNEAYVQFGHRNFHPVEWGSAGRNHTTVYVEGPAS